MRTLLFNAARSPWMRWTDILRQSPAGAISSHTPEETGRIRSLQEQNKLAFHSIMISGQRSFGKILVSAYTGGQEGFDQICRSNAPTADSRSIR